MKPTLVALLALCLCVAGCATLNDVGKHLWAADAKEVEPTNGQIRQKKTNFAEEYTIQIHRPEKVGSRFLVDVTVTSSEQRKVVLSACGEGRDPKAVEVKWSAQLKGIMTVEKVNEAGNATQIRIEVESFTRTADEFTEELEKKGAVILARHFEGVDIYESLDVDTKKKSPINQRGKVESLGKLFTLGKMTTKEAAYGTKDRQKIGDSWKVNGKAFAAVFSNQNITIDPNRIEGEVTLVKALLVNNVPCLELNAQIKIAGIKLQGLPPNMRLLKNSITISDTLIRPVDVNRVGLRQTVEIKGNMEFEQDGMLTAVVSNEKGFGKRKQLEPAE